MTEEYPPVPEKPKTGVPEPGTGLPDDLDHGDILTKFLDVCTIWCKALFANRPAGSYRFDPTASNSDILIGGARAEYDAELGRALPRVAVISSDVRFMGSSMSMVSDYGYTDPASDTTTYLDKLAMSVVFRVVARLDSEATKVAKFIADGLVAMRADIQKQARFADLICHGIRITAPVLHGSALPSSPSQEYQRVDVALPVHLTNTIRNNRTGYYDLVRQSFNFYVDPILNTVR